MKINYPNLLLLVTAFLLNSSRTFATEDEVMIWTPNELVRKGGEKLWDNVTEFVVGFRVASVRLVPTTYPNGDRRQVPHLVPTDEDDFTVPISQELEASLRKIGIADLHEHFTGKALKIRGCVSQTGLDLIGSETIWTFHITLRTLDQLLEVKSDQKTPAEQDDADQPATAVDSEAKGYEKPKPESEGRPQ